MVHLLPLPGSPGWVRAGRAGRTEDPVARAVADAERLLEAGFDGVVVENHGDAPFHARRVPPETVAAMAVAAAAVRRALGPGPLVGVNVLRNDARAALAIAAAAALDLVRVNVLSGAVVADQGIVEGEAAEVLRDRERLAPGVRILADVAVKHAAPLAPRDVGEEARDLVGRGGADALLVSGGRTGAPADRGRLLAVRAAVPGTPVLVASGVTADDVGAWLEIADGVLVGTSLKQGGVTDAPVDPERAQRFVGAARG
jgi:membrane complex biogenesis BtpA family protein